MKTEAKIRESFVFDHWTYTGAQAAHKEGKKTPMRPLLADMHTFALRPRDDEDEVFRRQKKAFKSEKRHIAQSTKLEKILETVHAIEEITNLQTKTNDRIPMERSDTASSKEST